MAARRKKKGATADLIISKSRTKGATKKCNVSADFYGALDGVVRGELTSDATCDAVTAVAEAVGKTPLLVADVPGFVSNRVLMPMINEAIFCLYEGVATAENIDGVMKLGMNHPMGPLALADLIGLDVCLFILEVLHRDLGEDRYRPCPMLRKLVQAGRLGRKSKHGFFRYE